jgi:kynurenine formamidase
MVIQESSSPRRLASSFLLVSLALLVVVGCTAPTADSGTQPQAAPALDLSQFEIVDLSHGYGADTLYWPTDTAGFQHNELAFGETEQGYFYSSYDFCTAEHGGTHLDAPIHFAEGGITLDQVPLSNLVAAAVVIDVSEQAAADPDYRVTAADIESFEQEHGAIAAGSAVLLRTGWSQRWPDALSYLGDDTPGDASNLHFPSYSEAAARLLVEQREVALLGVDTASIDYGPSEDFIVHQVASGAGVPGLENATNLDRLPATGAWLIALPIKIEQGSGGPVRAIALLP